LNRIVPNTQIGMQENRGFVSMMILMLMPLFMHCRVY